MSASTDARVSAEDKADNLINVGGRDAGTSPVWRVKINGKDHFVQTRLHRDGSITYLANETSGDIQRPYVLAQYNKDGVLKEKGGSGRIYYTSNFGTTTSGDVRIGQGPGNVEVTDRATAEAILATGTINGKAATESEQFDLGYKKALTLSKNRQANNPRNVVAPPDAFVPPPRQTADREDRDQIIKTPHNAENEPVVEPGESPPNNDPDASNGANSIGQFASGIAEGAEDLFKSAVPVVKEFLQGLQLTDEEIAAFDEIFENGGGDKIQSAAYPLDNTYGDIRGQDYVTIDQFVYQPPRRDQILGTGNENPIFNLTKGQQRLSPLKKFVAQVALPMPNNITDSNAVAWGADSMNNLSATLTAGIMRNPALGLLGGGLSLINPAIGKFATLGGILLDNEGIDGEKSVKNNFAAAMKMMEREGGAALMKTQMGSAMLGMLGVNASPESLLARGFGVVPNSNTELLFNNVTLRDFQFSWRMSPRDEEEAKMVKRIIRFFKQGMAAKTQANQAGERTLYLGSPNVFRMQYRTANGKIIEGVNRIKPCAVVGTAVNYTPDGQWSAYDEGQPVSCTIAIQMKELEPVYATDYSENVLSADGKNRVADDRVFDDSDIGETDGDLYRIRPTEVGY
jgi:hypothetical protein